FFFQAEDGIRDRNVTGVQTCALPILQGDQSKVDGAYGSISSLVDSKGGKWIYDFDTPYSSTGIKLDDDYLKQNPMSKAKDDYVGKIDDDEKNVKSLASIWTDRYVYGY